MHGQPANNPFSSPAAPGPRLTNSNIRNGRNDSYSQQYQSPPPPLRQQHQPVDDRFPWSQ